MLEKCETGALDLSDHSLVYINLGLTKESNILEIKFKCTERAHEGRNKERNADIHK